MTEHEKRIREALEAGPTEGPWVADHANPNLVAGDSDPYEYICQVAPAEFSESNHSYEQECINAAYIAACNPAAIRALLADLDAVRVEAVRYRKLRQQHEEADSGLTLCVFQPVNDSTLEPVGSMPGELDAAIDALKGASHE